MRGDMWYLYEPNTGKMYGPFAEKEMAERIIRDTVDRYELVKIAWQV